MSLRSSILFIVVATFLAVLGASAARDRTVQMKPSDYMAGVTELSPDNLDDMVGQVWLVHFYAPWSSWCSKLAPEWAEIGRRVPAAHPGVNIGKMDVAAYPNMVEHFEIEGYPTVILFTEDGSRHKYEGPWEADAIREFARHKLGYFV
eukprot:PhM_4_TR13181/c0_g1_i1/m.67099/K09585/TXNDC10; thioredoxin domain-containing protein 10